MMGKVLRTCAS